MKYKYEYMLHVWGGGIQENNLEHLTYQWFNTELERSEALQRIKNIVERGVNKGLAHHATEGQLTRHKFILKSLVLDKQGEYHWVINDLGFGFFTTSDLLDDNQQYLIDWKWGICTDLDLDKCALLNTSLIIEEPTI